MLSRYDIQGQATERIHLQLWETWITASTRATRLVSI